MSGKNNKKFKLAVCLLAIFGVSIFGLQQAKAVNVNNQSGLENINNYTRGEEVNITRDINLTNANLPDITGAINAVVNGNNNTISGSIFNRDADRTLTFGHYTLQDNSSLTFNNINFQTDTTIQGTQDWQSRAWTVAGLIAQNMASTSTVNINFSDFINNNVYLYQNRSGHNMDLQNYINGGLLNNAGKMNITSSDFNNNTIRVATYKHETSLRQDGYAHAEMYGGIITNYETGVLTINGNGTASMSNNNISAYSESSTDRDPVHAIVQGGVINNEGTALIDGVQINGNTVSASTNNYGDNATAQGGAIYNAQGASLTIQGDTSFADNSVKASGANSNTAQGGAVYNSGTLNLTGTNSFTNNSVTASATSEDARGYATAQGGAIYNAQGAILTIQGDTSFSGNSVNASGANSNTAQGGAIYNAGEIAVNGGNVTFSNNSANNAANDIYFANNSTMNLTGNSTVELGSGVQSANRNATISVKGGSNLIQANTNSGGYTGVINIASNGLLTFKGQDLGVINSLNNAEINLSQNSGLGFEIENNITLDDDDVMANFDTITPSGTLNIYKTGDNEMTLAGDFDGIADEYNISGGKLIASDENLASSDTVNVNNAEFEYSTKGEIVNNVSLSNGSTYTINANSSDEAITINNSPVFNGANNTVNLENGNYDLNTNFRSDEIQNININSSNVSFRGGGISQNTTVTNSVLNLSNNNIETTTFSNLTSNNSSVNLDIDLSNGKSDTIIAGDNSDGSLNLGELNFIGAASETEYNFQVITGGNLAFSDYDGTFESKVYKYAVGTEGQNITLNATGIASNGLKYYNHTLTGDRTFSFIGDEIYKIGQDLESTNAGGFIVNGKSETAKDSIISGDDFHSFFEVSDNKLSDNKLTVNNVTIQDALASNSDELLEGASTNTDGAVLNISGGSAEFNNVILQNNEAEGSGGVISATGGKVEINNSTITSNSAAYGGAINAYNDAKITINDSTISDNSATEGSAIYNAMGGSVILNDVEISNNTGSSSIYNEGENSTVSITNEKDNIINNGDNAVIKNTGTINITANNDTLTTIQDAIQNLDITDITTDTKGNIETKGNVTFSDITNQIVTQTNSTVQIENLTGSEYIANGNLYISGNVNSSIITSNAKAPDDVSYSLYLNVAENGSEITLNDGSAYIQSLNNSKLTVNGGRAENIYFVNNNSEVYINGGSYSGIGTISNGTTVTINNGVENSNTAISTANDSTIINTLGTTEVHNSNNTDIKNSGTISVENLQSGSSFTQKKGTSTITNAIEKSVIDIDGGTSTITQGNDVTITVDNAELNLGSDTATNALTNSSLTIGNAAEANLTGGNISGGEIILAAAQDSLNAGILNISGKDTTISSALSGGGTINKTEGGKLDLKGADGANAAFTGEINVSNKGTLAFDQNSTLNKDANINLDNSSTFNFVLTNAEDISLTDDGFSTVNLTNSSTMNVVGTGLNQVIQIQVGNGFWTSDDKGNTLNFANASYNLINEQGASEAANDILTFTNANLTLEENQIWENKIALDNTTLDLSNKSAGETYEFNHLDVSKDKNDLNIDVNLNIDNGAPVADQITVNEGSGFLELTQVFITDDNGGIVNYKDDEGNAIPIQIIQNVGENASVQLETNEDIEILSWSTNVYKYSINSAISDEKQGLIDSITVDPNGVASSDTLRDLNHYEGNRGFSFVIKGEDGQAVENKYQIYRDLDTTAAGNLTVIGRVDENGKSILSGELKELVIDENDQRYDAQKSTYTYLGPEQADGQRDVVDTAKVNKEPTLKDGEYTFAIGAMDNDNPTKENGSLFELTNATNLKITDVSLEDAYRGETDKIKNGSAIYAHNNSATVELNNVDFKNNTVSSGSGGAVANELSQSFLLDGSVIAGNSASENGGAFYNTSSGKTKIQNATFYGNSAGNLGGAIYTSSDMTIVNSNFGKDTNNVDNLNYIGTEPDKVANDIYIDKEAKLTFEVNENAVNKTSIIASGIMGSETSSFEKTGTGTLNLSGNNKDFKGDFILAEDGGKVLYEADSTGDSFVSGDVLIGQNSTLKMKISNSAVSESITQNINNVSGTGKFIKSGQGALNLGGNNSGFTGTAQINAGSLNYLADNNTDNYFSGATEISENAELNLTINDGISNNVNEISGDGTVNKFESGKVILSGNNSGFEGTLNINKGILEYKNSDGNSPEGTSYISGVTNMTEGSVFIANTDGLNYDFTDEINSSFKGKGTFIKEGFGTLKLSGVLKDLTGDVKIQTGNLEFIKNEDNGYINGNTFVGSGNTFIYNTNGIDSTLSHNIEDLTQGANGNFEKTGDGILTLQGDYSNLTGAATISEGTLKYIQNQGKYFGGHTNVDENGTLIFNTKGINSEISNITQSTEIGGTFIKEGEGTLTLSGANGSFDGKSYIDEGTLAFSNADGNTYFAGATTIADGAILAYTTGTDATLSNVLGQGTLQKLGSAALEFNYVNADNKKFEGEAVVDNGTLTVNAANNANSNFDFDMTVNNGKLVYNAAQNQSYNIGTADSKVSFGEKANNASITFNGGNYNLAGDIQNAVNNITNFTNATLTLGSENYNGNYNLSGGNVDLSDNVYSHHTFNNLEALNTNLSLDLGFKNPADETKYDKITVNSGNAKFNLISVNMIPDDGVNDTGGSAEDSGQDKTITFDILNGNATFNNKQSLSSYATNKYIYSVDYVDGQKIVFTQTGYSDGNTLKGQNIDKGPVREFQFDNDITLNNPYLLDEDLTTTHEGIFTVLGYKDDTAEEPVTVIDGGNDHSMFEVGDNTTLNVLDIHFTNAKASKTDIEGEDKSSKGIHGSILALTGGSATLDNVKATNNASDGKGGAIYVNGGNLTLNDIYFENNTHKLSADTEIDNDIYVEGGKTVNITGDSTVKSGLAGEGTVNTSGNFNLEGNNKDFKGTLLVSSGQATFTQNEGDTFISGTTEISKNADAIINNNYSEIEGTFKGEGNLTKEGSENLVLIGDNSLMTGNVTVEEGHIVLNTDGAAYFSGNTELKDNTGIIVSGSKDADLSNVSGSENSTVEKSGSGKLTFGGNGKYEGTVNIHEGALGLNYNSNYAIANANFASGTSLNLQNTVAINQNGQWTTNPNPSGIETITFDNINLEGPVDLFLDIDLKQGVADKIAANTVEGSGYLVLGYDGINAVTDALRDDSSVQIATGAITDYIKLEEEDMKVMGPIEEYLIGYDDGMLNFTKTGGNHPKYSQVNPGIMAGAVAAQMGGYLVQLNSYDEAFRNMDMYMLMTKKQREAMKHRNKYAYNGSSGIIYDASISRHENKSGWLRPFATFEQVDLDGGPDVSNVSYGSYFGMDSEFIDLGHGWDGVWSAYAGYNGSHQSYDGIGIYQNGGTLGVVGMAYKGNFFTGLTVNAGASAGRANVDMGYDDFTMLMSGVASKSGYNFELFDGKFIIQPSYMMSYSFVNMFDYTSAQGARVTSDPLHAIHIEPGIKFIGNLKNGWQPYAGISMIWNVMDKTRFMANEVYLPELSIKPFVKYGVGLRKSWGERFTGYLQTYITNGGRNGVGLQAGFNWALGKPVVRERQAFGITPSVESVKFAKKTK